MVWPSRIITRAPAPGTVFPSHVPAADHGPFFADLMTTGSAAKLGAAHSTNAAREVRNRTAGSGGNRDVALWDDATGGMRKSVPQGGSRLNSPSVAAQQPVRRTPPLRAGFA